jgi:hypothetical protein
MYYNYAALFYNSFFPEEAGFQLSTVPILVRNVDVLRYPNLASNLLMGFISLWIWFLHRSVCATIGIRGPLYFLRYGLAADCANDVQMNSMKVLAFRDDPLPAPF